MSEKRVVTEGLERGDHKRGRLAKVHVNAVSIEVRCVNDVRTVGEVEFEISVCKIRTAWVLSR